jgi:hypothetical protein
MLTLRKKDPHTSASTSTVQASAHAREGTVINNLNGHHQMTTMKPIVLAILAGASILLLFIL